MPSQATESIRRVILLCVLFASIVSPFVFQSAVAQSAKEKKAAAAASNIQSGADLYKAHCAVCHGDNLRGTGPTPSPYRPPPDLTLMARRHGGNFPTAYVKKILGFGVPIPEHGPAEMPIWGSDLTAGANLSEAEIKLRIANLTNFIKSSQIK
jgi:mono/diheme cytochrome c family protein